jgi:hypothetical protein
MPREEPSGEPCDQMFETPLPGGKTALTIGPGSGSATARDQAPGAPERERVRAAFGR